MKRLVRTLAIVFIDSHSNDAATIVANCSDDTKNNNESLIRRKTWNEILKKVPTLMGKQVHSMMQRLLLKNH